MDVILLEKIDNLGGIGDKVKVKPGYGRNYLLPQGKACVATAENVAKLEARRAELENKATQGLSVAQERAEKLKDVSIRLSAKVGAEGKLFGSVGTIDIAQGCEEAGFHVERSEVRLPDGPIRVAGEHQVELHLHTDVNVPLQVTVEGEEVVEE